MPSIKVFSEEEKSIIIAEAKKTNDLDAVSAKYKVPKPLLKMWMDSPTEKFESSVVDSESKKEKCFCFFLNKLKFSGGAIFSYLKMHVRQMLGLFLASVFCFALISIEGNMNIQGEFNPNIDLYARLDSLVIGNNSLIDKLNLQISLTKKISDSINVNINRIQNINNTTISTTKRKTTTKRPAVAIKQICCCCCKFNCDSIKNSNDSIR